MVLYIPLNMYKYVIKFDNLINNGFSNNLYNMIFIPCYITSQNSVQQYFLAI